MYCGELKIDLLVIFLQFLEQEKQRLRGQLELMEDEYEQRILELQTDIDTLKAKLNDSGDSDSRLRERSNLVAQLVIFVPYLILI